MIKVDALTFSLQPGVFHGHLGHQLSHLESPMMDERGFGIDDDVCTRDKVPENRYHIGQLTQNSLCGQICSL